MKKKASSGKLSLEIAQAIRNYHHKALWEEQKHFTWWISIVLSAQILLYLNISISSPIKLLFILMSSVVGLFLCIMAIITIRKEGEYFQRALSEYVIVYNEVNCERPLPPVEQRSNNSLPKLCKAFFKGELGIRDVFQLIFIFFVFIFILVAAFAILEFVFFPEPLDLEKSKFHLLF